MGFYRPFRPAQYLERGIDLRRGKRLQLRFPPLTTVCTFSLCCSSSQPRSTLKLCILATYPEAKPQISAGKEIAKAIPNPAIDRDALHTRRDTNKDGLLTMDEFMLQQRDGAAARARFPNFDKDQDGKLSRKEFVNP